ncbi:hypothetical protein ACIP9C_02685 [Lysinibacillus sp. NPDC093210]|uniref:hypothetical protein n=1 Tax=Lysinibacillus sp. NPDC093210 TaxID=3364133 RepID=UPI0037F66AA2
MSNQPIVSWYEGTNEKSKEVNYTVDYKTVDAASQSDTKIFYIWNNRGGTTDAPKMEEVTFTTRDRSGGTGDLEGKIVEAVKDNWFHVRVDSLSESRFLPVGKGGNPLNPSGTKDLGTNGTTTNIHAATAQVWSAGTAMTLDAYVQPTSNNNYIYKVSKAGTTGATQPSWPTVEGNAIMDGTVEYLAIKIDKTPKAKEILGLANVTNDAGTNVDLAGGNFVKISVYADVPMNASAGKNQLMQRVSYRYV